MDFTRGARALWSAAAATAIITALMLGRGASFAAADSFSQQAILKARHESGSSELGAAVALSQDGKTALLGGPRDANGIGAAWVFVRHGAKWVEQAKLTANDESGEGQFGSGVALSGDGKTALIGAPKDSEGRGAAWVFTWSHSRWSQRGP